MYQALFSPPPHKSLGTRLAQWIPSLIPRPSINWKKGLINRLMWKRTLCNVRNLNNCLVIFHQSTEPDTCKSLLLSIYSSTNKKKKAACKNGFILLAFPLNAYKNANGSVPAFQVQCVLPSWPMDHTLFSGSKTNNFWSLFFGFLFVV